MLSFLKDKLLHKKWMNACLLIGVVLLTAIAVSHPMYEENALNKVLQAKMDSYITENNTYPSIISKVGGLSSDNSIVNKASSWKEDYENNLLKELKVEDVYSNMLIYTDSFSTTNTYKNDDVSSINFIGFAYMNEFEYHADIVDGVGTDSENSCVISEEMADTLGLTVGEEINFSIVKDEISISLVVAGIYKPSDITDKYWIINPNQLSELVIVSASTMDKIYSECGVKIYYDYKVLLNYDEIEAEHVDNIYNVLKTRTRDSETFTTDLTDILVDFKNEEKIASALLWVLQLPIFVLLAAFIYMISSQILQMESGEISMLKSRGVSRIKLIFLYMQQSAILGVIAFIIGIPLSFGISSIAGSANSFMEFIIRDNDYGISIKSVLYGLGALIVSITFMTVPVISYSKVGIVEQKSKAKLNEKPLWEKMFLDVILLAVSIYALISFNNQKDSLASRVINGESMDVFLFLSASVFMLAVGMFSLRLIRLITKLVFALGKKFFKPALYASFLQIIRTGKKQSFISIFLVLTIAMGIYNAILARTINQTAEDRIVYDNGADVVIKEKWEYKTVSNKEIRKLVITGYKEPEFSRYIELDNSVESLTKVARNDLTTVRFNGTDSEYCDYMGVSTKEFGETAYLKPGVLDEHWYNYLNMLSQDINAVIISDNLQKQLDVEVGDSISYSCNFERTDGVISYGTATGTVVAVVDVWPGCNSYVTTTDEKGNTVEAEKGFIIGNISKSVDSFGVLPYEIWLKIPEGEDTSIVYDFLSNKNITTDYIKDTTSELIVEKNDAMTQLTNGMLTISFATVLVLCMIGFLIYWVLAIKQRELIFGVYRAMGMTMKEIVQMLINEQIFGSILSIIVGAGTGILSSILYAPIITLVYSPYKHNLDFELVINSVDMIRLVVIISFMLIIGVVVLGSILKKMNITQALKLGED